MKKVAVSSRFIYVIFPSSLGWLGVAEGEAGLKAISLGGSGEVLEEEMFRLDPSARLGTSPWLLEARRQLLEYLGGKRRLIQLPLDFSLLSHFRRATYEELTRVPFGETISYGDLAARIGRPKAARAVGRALALNPFPLAVPCHRVVAADGSLQGFSGGEGIATKRRLLELEAASAKD